ncbi:pathogenesis-related protein PRB1-3-like [Elaeis guineensis]
MIHTTIAQNSPEDFASPHNYARAAVGVGPVSWNDSVAAYAQDYANQRSGDCQLVHSDGSYGENLFGGSGADYMAADAVNSWVSEKQYHDYNSNTCADGQVCGHYTQVVWRDSTNIGCARVVCDNGGIFITCNYYPPGNFVGQRQY